MAETEENKEIGELSVRLLGNWRQPTESSQMIERRPSAQEQSGEVVKVVIGIDPDRV